jgi:hypothetical protein
LLKLESFDKTELPVIIKFSIVEKLVKLFSRVAEVEATAKDL